MTIIWADDEDTMDSDSSPDNDATLSTANSTLENNGGDNSAHIVPPAASGVIWNDDVDDDGHIQSQADDFNSTIDPLNSATEETTVPPAASGVIWGDDLDDDGEVLSTKSIDNPPSETTSPNEKTFPNEDQDPDTLEDLPPGPTSQMYMLFKLNDQSCGIPIHFVKEVILKREIIRLPDTPTYFNGILNLRGNVISVIDLKKRFSITSVNDRNRQCIIILDLPAMQLGLLVDEVSRVTTVYDHEINQKSLTTPLTQGSFVSGVCKIDDQLTVLIDIIRLVTNQSFKATTHGHPLQSMVA